MRNAVLGSSQYVGAVWPLPDSVASTLSAIMDSVTPMSRARLRLASNRKVGWSMICWMRTSAAPGTVRRRAASLVAKA
jgi:hypothetical protein